MQNSFFKVWNITVWKISKFFILNLFRFIQFILNKVARVKKEKMLKLFKNQLDLLVNKNIISARTIFTSSLVPNQQATGSSNSNLFKIRKATGYALNRCKEALEKNNGNIEEV